jgi:hypothetical protein
MGEREAASDGRREHDGGQARQQDRIPGPPALRTRGKRDRARLESCDLSFTPDAGRVIGGSSGRH